MADKMPQTFENHARIVPGFHIVTFSIFVLNVLWTAYRAATGFSWDRLIALVFAVGVLLLFFYARAFAVRVQDRVIRLEMRLRLREVLPPELRGRIKDLTVRQLIALRFASDAELPDLCSKVLSDRIDDRKTIKKMIRHWQADYLRA